MKKYTKIYTTFIMWVIIITGSIVMTLNSCSSMESRKGGSNRIQVKETAMIGNKLFSIIEIDSVEYIVNKESIVPLIQPCK